MTNAREKYRKGLSNLYLPLYDSLCNLLPPEWEPRQGLRTVEYQNELYAQGRTVKGLIVTKAKGGESAHNYGCATDWYPFIDGKPIYDTKDKIWEVYVNACEKAGLFWGGNFGDFPHNELHINISYKNLKEILDKEGMEAAMKKISESII